jgi:hypothetical protein
MEPLTIRLPQGLRRQIKIAAAGQDISMNAWIVQAIGTALRERTNREEDAMSEKIEITIYPAHLTQESVEDEYLARAAEAFVNEVAGRIHDAYPNAEIAIDIKPVNDSGFDGGVSCEDRDIQEHAQHLSDQVFNEGNFWPKEED